MSIEDIKISEFNEMQFKMIRIHKLQDQVNELWINPLMPNLSFGDYNYNLIISILDSLYSEVYPKCTEGENKEVKALFEKIDEITEKESPFEFSTHPTSKKAKLNQENWKKLKKEIKKLNLKVRELLQAHGFSPDKDDDLVGL